MELAPYWSNLFHRKISRFLEEFVFIDFASKLSSWWTNLNKLIFSAFSSAFNCLRMMLNQFVEYRRVRENLAIGIGNYFTNMFFFAFHFFVTVFQDQNLKSRRLRESKETLKKLLLQERQERLYVLLELHLFIFSGRSLHCFTTLLCAFSPCKKLFKTPKHFFMSFIK